MNFYGLLSNLEWLYMSLDECDGWMDGRDGPLFCHVHFCLALVGVFGCFFHLFFVFGGGGASVKFICDAIVVGVWKKENGTVKWWRQFLFSLEKERKKIILGIWSVSLCLCWLIGWLILVNRSVLLYSAGKAETAHAIGRFNQQTHLCLSCKPFVAWIWSMGIISFYIAR